MNDNEGTVRTSYNTVSHYNDSGEEDIDRPPSDDFWTSDQLRLLADIPRTLHVALGVALTLISVFGIVANFIILYIFSRFKRLRTPANVFVINLTFGDLCACLLHPMSAYSALVHSRWSFGRLGCNLYGMGVCFFGLNTIATLSVIAFERYIVITGRPSGSKWRITRRQASKACLLIWFYCAALSAPPWAMGWSSYLPEGVLITCSWDYTTKTLSNRLYYAYLLSFGFVFPVAILTYCYSTIIRYILTHSREMKILMRTNISYTRRRKQTDLRTAKITLMLALHYFTAWSPYVVVSMIGQFGPDDYLTPLATSIPAFLAKLAALFDPMIYGLSHPQFRTSVRQLFQNSLVETMSGTSRRNAVHREASTPNRTLNNDPTASHQSLKKWPSSRTNSTSKTSSLINRPQSSKLPIASGSPKTVVATLSLKERDTSKAIAPKWIVQKSLLNKRLSVSLDGHHFAGPAHLNKVPGLLHSVGSPPSAGRSCVCRIANNSPWSSLPPVRRKERVRQDSSRSTKVDQAGNSSLVAIADLHYKRSPPSLVVGSQFVISGSSSPSALARQLDEEQHSSKPET